MDTSFDDPDYDYAASIAGRAMRSMAEQRIPNMRGIMAARTKPLNIIPAASSIALTSVKSYTLNAGRTTCKMFTEENLDELVGLLHTEAKVI